MAPIDNPRQPPQELPHDRHGNGSKPIWFKRYWTGTGTVKISVFSTTVDTGDRKFTVYSTTVERTYDDVPQDYTTVHSFRPEDLLVLAHAAKEAFTWITSQVK